MADGIGMRSWRRLDVPGSGTGRFERVASGWTVHGAEVLSGDQAGACWFRVELDVGWRTTAAEVRSLSGAGEAVVRLVRTGTAWTVDGEAAPALDGCEDVDVAAVPVANTFPIRRLDALPVGAARTMPVAWIDVPSVAVQRVEQTYERLGPLSWRYRDDVFGAFLLEVDEEGVVTRYEGFAERVG